VGFERRKKQQREAPKEVRREKHTCAPSASFNVRQRSRSPSLVALSTTLVETNSSSERTTTQKRRRRGRVCSLAEFCEGG
jgi:hypothetical protein